jgi:hypothetical protein
MLAGGTEEAGQMTMRTRSPLICQCGHKGFLRCSENDQPYSSLWEDYDLEGFAGKSLTITNYKDKPDDLIAYLLPECPDCKEVGKVTYAPGK